MNIKLTTRSLILVFTGAAAGLAGAAQPLINLDEPREAAARRLPIMDAYAPAEPPAASVPGTLYVPAGFERGLNEPDAQFVARMKVKQDAATKQQAVLLSEHAAAMQRIAQISGGRQRTAEDDAATAAWQQSVQQEQVEHQAIRARRAGGTRAGQGAER
ncbi:hypothetical protein [Pseudoxanthomonas kaohsiungensis]|uniref:DUF4168 domain-containing protein n=1 Tax=Pseudoxanthomonas kaohsiungensis TaxID=283923 RepID=A0ABW3LY38_9GAMM|nr:hypothetical protein [Pseudoxanthomonas kaohsiungensis]KAF1702950.1 hypothetical protein CSC66_09245 [Pseudoxanthomonas kaohsiungensis]